MTNRVCGTRAFAVLLVSGIALAGPANAESPVAEQVDYNQHIKPILSGRCYACHGPDEGQRKADLRLDLGEEATKTAIRPGDSATSPLFLRITSQDPEEVMPPADSKVKPLTPAEIELIRQWIDAGARFDQHWAYVPPVGSAPPAPRQDSWTRGPIDQFVLSTLEEHGFEPSPEADRATLARRLSFDLLGLPPSMELVAAFTADESPDAYERLVDQLLASPHFGERMAMYWLDLVRYGDTNGYHADLHRNIHPYRDYVIQSFNGNKPFDQFTVEQLAGDLLPEATLEQRIASGFNRLNMTTTEGGAQSKEYLAKYAADRVRNTAAIWLGATLGCAECHDHKYDPFLTRDFYRFAAFFSDLKQEGVYPNRIQQDPEVKVPSPDEAAQLAQLDAAIAGVQAVLAAQTPELDAAQSLWEEQTRSDIAAGRLGWIAHAPEAVASMGGAMLTPQEDKSVLASGESPANDVYTVTIRTDQARITGLRLQALTDPTLSGGKLSRAGGNFVLTGLEVDLTEPGGAPRKVNIASALADFEQQGFPVAAAIDDKSDTGWAVSGHEQPADRTAVFLFAEPLAGGPATMLTVRLRHDSQFAGHTIGRFRLSLSAADKPTLDEHGVPKGIFDVLGIAAPDRTVEQRDAISGFFRGVARELDPARAELTQLTARRQQVFEAVPTTLVSTSAPAMVTRILPRGNWLDESGEVVTPGVPAFLPQLADGQAADRLALARWVVSRENPLTARVFVNRLWKLLFGAGLAATADDFGSQGSRPTHPALLDHLAIDFVEGGWNVKHTLKTIVMSATYRQSSAAPASLREQDPKNRWLARQARLRLDAEMVRDNALAISGLLSTKIGGRSVKPYQPDGYWDHCNTFLGKLVYDQDHNEDLYRRGLYTYWKRTFLHPSLAAFDAPTREECTVDRPRSSTPLQALVLLNDPTYVEAARVLAERTIRAGGDTPDQRLAWMIQRALARPIRPEETAVLAALYEKHKAEFAADPEAARQLNASGEWPAPADIDATDLAAWTSVARVILNLHETITRY